MYREEPQLPPRPHLPLSLWALAAAWMAVRLVAQASFDLTPDALLAVSVIGGLLALAGAAVLWALEPSEGRDVARAVCAAVLAGALGMASAGWRYRGQAMAAQDLASSAVSSWELHVTSDATEGAYGYRCRAAVTCDGRATASVWVQCQGRLERGCALSCVGRYRHATDDEYGRSGWAQGVCGSVLVVRVRKTVPTGGIAGHIAGVRRRALEAIDPAAGEGRALLAGCACGSREALDAWGLTDEFAACGISHLIAVSGAHIALVSLLLTRLLEPTGVHVGPRLAILMVVTGLFVLFCGAPPSALRAWAMSLVGSGAQLAGRRGHALSSIAAVALVFVLADPTLASSLGFELSALSVAGLCLYASYANYALRCLLPTPLPPRWVDGSARKALQGCMDAVRASVGACLVCQLVTLPVTARIFGRVSLVAPLANLLLGPVVGAVLASGLAVCLLSCLPGLAGWVAGACDALAAPPLWLVHRLARLPWASVSVAAFPFPVGMAVIPALVALLLAWPRVSRRVVGSALAAVALALLVLVVRWRAFAEPRIVVLDIGQGDAILVQDGTSAVLVDAGPPDGAVTAALARQHVLHLDAVVVTHLHDDHYGGLEALATGIGCDRVYVARGVAAAMDGDLRQLCLDACGAPPDELSYGDAMHVGRFRLRVIWPTEPVDGDENRESLEMTVEYDGDGRGLTALLTGDAERDETGACILAGDVTDIDLLKVGHHGSEVSLTADEAQALRPEVAVASAGEGNRFGHPTPTCVQILEDAGSWVLCTKDVGDVEVRPDTRGPCVLLDRRSSSGE